MRLVMVVMACVLAAGCATASGGGERRDRREITRAEIEAASNASTAQDLVRRLRPEWLRTRGTGTFSRTEEEGILVYVDGTRAGMVEMPSAAGGGGYTGRSALESIPASGIVRIRYYNATEATQKYGTGHVHGAIEVTTRG